MTASRHTTVRTSTTTQRVVCRVAGAIASVLVTFGVFHSVAMLAAPAFEGAATSQLAAASAARSAH